MNHSILPRLGAASGALFVVLLVAPGRSESTAALVSELLGLLCMIPFLGYLWRVLGEAEGPGGWLATTALGAGLVDVTIKLGSLGPGKVAQDYGDATDMHQALEKMNNVAFIVTMLPLGVMMAAVAAVTLARGGLPKALGWLAAVAAPLLLANGMFLDTAEGPAFLLFLLWTLLASVVLTRRAGGVRSAGAAEQARTP
jgi:hypothetical protein